MTINKTIEGSVVTLAIAGWLDTSTTPEFASALLDLGDSCEKLVIDLAELEYISSAGLRQLVSAHKQMKGNLTIANVPVEVMQVLRMAGFDKRLNIV